MSWNCFNVNVRFAPIAKSSLADLANHPRDNTQNIKHYGGVGAVIRGGRIVQYRNSGERGYPRGTRRYALGSVAVALLAPAVANAQTALPDINVISTTPLSGTRSPQRSVAPPAPVRPARATHAEPATPGRATGARTTAVRTTTRTAPAAPATPVPVPPIQGPAASGEISRDKVPSNTEVITSEEFRHDRSTGFLDTLSQSLPGVFIGDQSGNPFQRDVNYRGFVASPVPGTPQGHRGLPERRAHQRGLWRRRQLGLHPGDGDPQARRWCPTTRSSASTPSAARSASR